MEISDFPWLPLEFSELFSIPRSPHRSRMRSHDLLVADLIDSYRSPRCITQNMALSRIFMALYSAQMGGHGIVSIVSIVWSAQQYAPYRRHTQHALLSFQLPQVLDV